MDTPIKVELLGERHAYRPPPFADRADILLGFARHADRDDLVAMRLMAATVGLATRIGERAKLSYTRLGCDVLAYGGAVYGWLREQGATDEQIVTAGIALYREVVGTHAPTKEEVKAEMGNSEGGGA